jgi:hypothetical protein
VPQHGIHWWGDYGRTPMEFTDDEVVAHIEWITTERTGR